MKVTFISNYFTHHQSELSKALAKMEDVSYRFIETQIMEDERKNMGWAMSEIPSYVFTCRYYEENREVCQQLIDESDVVILGSAPLMLVKGRLKNGQLTFFYSERIYKSGYEAYKFPIRFLRFFRRYGRYKNTYMLCASAFTAADFAKTFTFLNKTYKWGYFPKAKEYASVEKIVDCKKPASILWVARLIEWKHPDTSIRIAKKLKENGCEFELNIIGTGVMEQELEKMISDYNLENEVHMLGSMKPEEVRERMEQSQIFLFTSDRNEGWGAVLNESMNSACAVVASSAIGSVPFLMKDGENGCIYKDGDEEDLYRKVKLLLENNNLCREYGRQAYLTITDEWSPQIAAERFVELSKAILSGNKKPDLFADGPCSKAEILRDEWYMDEK